MLKEANNARDGGGDLCLRKLREARLKAVPSAMADELSFAPCRRRGSPPY
jgi:hypothetical protein